MATISPTLAKLSRPRLFDALPRQRLFDRLDDARRHPVVWVVAPPGAGKTTLVASWLEQRRLPGLWYQVDPGDADPATFFHYLGLAERIVDAGATVIGDFAATWAADLFAEAGRRFVPAGLILPDHAAVDD